MTKDERAGRLAGIVQQLITRVRDDDPDAVMRYLDGALADWVDEARLSPVDELKALVILAACHIPEDRTPRELLAWWTGEPILPPPPSPAQLMVERFGARPPWHERRAKPSPVPARKAAS